jgi:hypothetical protein
MIEKRNIETFMRVNGIPATADDEEIRSVLISARWNENEVDTALMVLKENTLTKQTHVDTMHKVFNTDDRLSAAEISNLLGIDVQLSNHDTEDASVKRARIERTQGLLSFALSIVIALSSIGYLMYQEKAGIFNENIMLTE